MIKSDQYDRGPEQRAYRGECERQMQQDTLASLLRDGIQHPVDCREVAPGVSENFGIGRVIGVLHGDDAAA